jgi:hypothetical protein
MRRKTLRTVRGMCWVLGLVGVFALGYALPWGGPWREVGPLALVLALALIGLSIELWTLARRSRSRPGAGALRDRRPADGEVGIAPMAGVRGEPNPIDPRFQRFNARDPDVATATVDEPVSDLGTETAPPLLGRVALISLFLGRDGRAWSEAEIARAHTAMFRAGAWIEREAIRWNAPVNIELARTYFVADLHEPDEVEIAFFPKGEIMQPFESQAVTKALTHASRAARQLGFRDASALIGAINPRVPADARVWLLHPRQAGHSLAVPLAETELSGVSLAVCYAREANFPEPLEGPPFTDPVTIVHELLHLFGATDKYGVSLRAFPPKSVTTREIMRLDEPSLSRSRIDPLTAREIGWLGRG